MPRLKQTENFISVVRLLKGYGLNAPKLATVLMCSAPTARKKITNPELLTLGDMKAISQKAHIPIEEVRNAIKWD